MQRLFSMFPDGRAGVALLILRASASGSLLEIAYTQGAQTAPSWIGLGVGAVILLLGAGALTPIACAIGIVIEAFYFPHTAALGMSHTALGIMTFLTLALLGPGAFSLDAKRFGRRLILPDRD